MMMEQFLGSLLKIAGFAFAAVLVWELIVSLFGREEKKPTIDDADFSAARPMSISGHIYHFVPLKQGYVLFDCSNKPVRVRLKMDGTTIEKTGLIWDKRDGDCLVVNNMRFFIHTAFYDEDNGNVLIFEML